MINRTVSVAYIHTLGANDGVKNIALAVIYRLYERLTPAKVGGDGLTQSATRSMRIF